jgi:ferric-dicitrate binding protein FerR (iron transport regulator)
MNAQKKSIKQPTNTPEDFTRISDKLTIKWDRPKEEIWQQMVSGLARESQKQAITIGYRPALQWAIAAMFVLIFSISGVMRFYTTTFITRQAEHQLVTLPDGSTVQLNAESKITVHPYWWRFSRQLAFEGEAFFKVEKGRKFTVASTNGTTQVLGTSFNIYARENSYRVACLSGKVRVTDPEKKHETIIKANQKAEWLDGSFQVRNMVAENETAWINNQFIFTATPIREVFREIERQYAISIQYEESLSLTYSGNFSKTQTPEQVLAYVCRPFSLNFEQIKPGQFRVSQNK